MPSTLPAPRITHEPAGYRCPLCGVAAGREPGSVVFEDERVVAAVSLHQKTGNPGALLVFPRTHVENLYTLPDDTRNAVFAVAQGLAIALKRGLRAEGVTVSQNNEPAGGQDVWHLHVHVVPRHRDDGFRDAPWQVASIALRASLAAAVRSALGAETG